jgi:NAD+ kinase
MFKIIGVVSNPERDPGLEFAGRVTGLLNVKGRETASGEGVFDRADVIVALGGDGTMLRTARRASMRGTPVLGINLGTLGYLTDVEKDEAEQALDNLLAGRFRVESRMMLCVDAEMACGPALNDVCVTRRGAKLLSASLSINGEPLDTIRADGIVIATPTGSTAYNLSAGGPILKPDCEMTVITAICPHTLTMRPLVVSAADVVSVRMHNDAEISMDGESVMVAPKGSVITVKRSSYAARVIKTKDLGFYEILRRKLMM